MVTQYPHYLFAVYGGESVQNADGSWGDGDTNTSYVGRCREETDGRGSEVQVAGGTYHLYTSLVQLPKGTARIDDGVDVIISNDAECKDIRVKGTVLKFDVGQMHSRLWL